MDSRINIPNTITAARLLLTIPLAYFLSTGKYTAAMTTYISFCALDILDGFLARLLNMATIFGKNFDFTTDAIFGTTAVIMLFITGRMPATYFVLLAIPMLIKTAFVLMSVRILKNTFRKDSWGRMNGTVYFTIPLLFMTQYNLLPYISYILLAYTYAAAVKYIFESYSAPTHMRKT